MIAAFFIYSGVFIDAYSPKIGVVIPGSATEKLGRSRSDLSLRTFTAHVLKPIKIPVWPVWGGVIAQLADWMGSKGLSEAVLKAVGGRVVPITLGEEDLSPFLLLAHHTHSFTPYDFTRQIVNTIQPEGFPAHPHAGFSTLTITMEGGLRHRDSAGESSSYGDGDIQFMNAGHGIVHEEMWDVAKAPRERHQRVEIYQLWVNSPRDKKFAPSATNLVAGSDVDVIPLCDEHEEKVGEIKLLCGELRVGADVGGEAALHDSKGSGLVPSRVCVAHLHLNKGVSVDITAKVDDSFALYVRRGSVEIPTEGDGAKELEALPGELIKFTTSNDEKATTGNVVIKAGGRGLNALLLIGEKLREPVLMRGPFVQATQDDLVMAAAPFQALGNSLYWDHTISDSDWREHTQKIRLEDIIERFGQFSG